MAVITCPQPYHNHDGPSKQGVCLGVLSEGGHYWQWPGSTRLLAALSNGDDWPYSHSRLCHAMPQCVSADSTGCISVCNRSFPQVAVTVWSTHVYNSIPSASLALRDHGPSLGLGPRLCPASCGL